MRELFETTIERLLADHVDPALIARAEDGEWPAALWGAVEETGLALAVAPEDFGGAGAGWSDAYALVRAAGRHAAPIPLAEALLANWLLVKAGLDPLAGPVTVAEGGGLSVTEGQASGVLAGVPWGSAVPHVVTICGVAQPKVVLLATRDATVSAARNTAREPRDDLAFTNAQVVASAPLPASLSPDDLRLGGAMLRSAQIAGALERILDQSVQYANERVQFGKPIGKFQALQHNLAVLSEQAALAAGGADTAFAVSDRRLSAFHIAAAKICASEAAGVGAAIAHAAHGAIGFTYEHSLHFATRRLWSWRSEFGSQSWWSERIGRQACAGGRDGLWAGITAGGFKAA